MPTPLVIVSWFYDDQPGFLDFRYRIEAAARHHDVTLVLRDERFVAEFADIDCRIAVLPTRGTDRRSLLRYCWRACALARATRGAAVLLLGSQVALCSFLLPRSTWVSLYWNEHPSHVFHTRSKRSSVRLFNRALAWISFRAAAAANRVMPIGEALLEDLQQHGVAARRMRLIYMGVADRFAQDVPEMGRSMMPPRPLQLIYTGTVSAERGCDVMLDGLALARAGGADCELTLVGATPEQQAHCLDRARALGIEQSIKVMGRVPGNAIPALLAQAHAGVCLWEDRPWWRFNPPTKLFEYLVAGLPVLASRIRTHTDYIADGQNGFVFDYAAAAFGDAVLRLSAARSTLPALSLRAHESGRRFLWPEVESAFLAALVPNPPSR